MSNTVLGFWDFFWIWFIVIIAGGGSTYLSSRDTAKLDALEKKIAALTEALRENDAPEAAAPAVPAPHWLKRDVQS
jgi:hypothetical protein